MRYMFAIFVEPAERTAEDLAAWRAYEKALRAAGVYIDGSRLQHPTTATTVSLVGGRRRVQDGPFADSKEQLGGYLILELPSLDQALDWAARCPAATYGTIEVRPLAPTPQPA